MQFPRQVAAGEEGVDEFLSAVGGSGVSDDPSGDVFGNGTEKALQIWPLVSDDHVQTEWHVTLLDYERSGYALAINGPSWFSFNPASRRLTNLPTLPRKPDWVWLPRRWLALTRVFPSNGPTLVMGERLGGGWMQRIVSRVCQADRANGLLPRIGIPG